MNENTRNVIYIVIGDDNWEPTPKEMEEIVKIFQSELV